jgi:hypothetical protein
VPEESMHMFDKFVQKGISFIDVEGNTLLMYYIALAEPPDLEILEYLFRWCDNICAQN